VARIDSFPLQKVVKIFFATEPEFRALQKANPNSAISRRLLANLRAMRR
jgi:hypothetical protein